MRELLIVEAAVVVWCAILGVAWLTFAVRRGGTR